jgi:hypothetical protein
VAPKLFSAHLGIPGIIGLNYSECANVEDPGLAKTIIELFI